MAITDPVGLATTLAYAGDRVTSIIDPANRVTRFEYDSSGNLTRITDPDGAFRDFNYDARRHLISEIDKRGFRGSDNLVRSITDARGNTTFLDYDDQGNVISRVDEEDRPPIIFASITAAGETDIYEFNLTEATGFYIDAISEGTTDAAKINVELQKKFGSQWLFVTESNLNAVDANGVADEDVVRFLTAGRHRIMVSGVGDYTGDYAFRAQSSNAGFPISLGQAVAGVTENPSESDLYTLDGKQGDQWFITSELLSGSLGAFLRVLDPTGNVLTRFALNRDGGLVTLPRDGAYTFLVEGDLNSSDETEYAFTAHAVDTEARPTELNQPVTGNLLHRGQVDRYVVNVADESLVRFDVRLLESLVTLRLSGPTGEIVPEQNLTAIENGDGAILLQPGNYDLSIKSLDGPGRYDVRLVDLFQSELISFDERVEAGNLDGRAAGAYRLDTSAGDQLRIELLTRTSGNPPSTRVRIIDQYGNQFLNQPLTGLDSEFTTTIDGPLFVFFQAPVTATSSDFYVFSLTKLGNDPPVPVGGVPLAFDQQIAGTADAGSSVTYEFTLDQRTLLRFDPQSNRSAIWWIAPIETAVSRSLRMIP